MAQRLGIGAALLGDPGVIAEDAAVMREGLVRLLKTVGTRSWRR